MLSEKFVTEYLKLDTERDAGENIWRLCEMSAQVVVPRGTHFIDDKYHRKQESGDTLLLARACRKNEDTLGRRAFAWRMWERFLETELRDENGEELDWDHLECRRRLFYSHFAVIGKMVESGEITDDTGVMALIMAIKDNYSVPAMVGTLEEIMEVEEYFSDTAWPRFVKKAKKMLSYPQVIGRRRRLLKELAATDWEAKENADVR